jgi:tungstate transport system ATP-binding protein
MSVVIDLHQASVRFGRVQALQGVSLQVHPGQCVALIGGNGSGKSTLLRLMHGLIAPTTGRAQRDAGARQAFVFQKPFVLRCTVLTNVSLAAWLAGQTWADAKTSALQALDEVGLKDLASRQARTLSGGQQQRLVFARALAAKPQVLLLDEPTASLSPQAKREVEALMQRCAQRGITVVFASHNLGQVKRLAQRVLFLDQGQLLCDTDTHSFFTNPMPVEATLFMQGESA